MKIIGYRKRVLISAFNGPTASITPALIDELMAPIEKNKAIIIDAGLDLEKVMGDIIAYYFFKRTEALKEESNDFKDQVIDSEWCSFNSKKKLLTYIINKKGYLKGDEKSTLENLLRKVMTYRNAFTHGAFPTDGREVRLQYFNGTAQTEITLTDEYFTKIESDFNQCLELLNKVANDSGTYIIHSPAKT